MHRATPLNSSFRSFVSGGAGSVVGKVDDSKLLQEMEGSFMKNEKRSKVEAPQNYGFSSVTADADKPEAKEGSGGEGAAGGEGPDGGMGAEAFITFAGGNRSFPTAVVIDDRRHRLKGLEKGDTAMFGQRDWGQQFHFNKTGMWMTGNVDKKIKIQLVKNEQEDERGGQGKEGSGRSSVGAAQAQQQQQKKAKGQKQLYDKESSDFIEITKDKITIKRGDAHIELTGKCVIGYFGSNKKSFRADAKHTHIRHEANMIWADATGCWSSVPIQTKRCQDED